jgi:hypothetical protein
MRGWKVNSDCRCSGGVSGCLDGRGPLEFGLELIEPAVGGLAIQLGHLHLC